MAGGCNSSRGPNSNVEVLVGDLGIMQLSSLPKRIYKLSLVLQGGTILLCGGAGNSMKCFQLDHGHWKEHSVLNKVRYGHSAVSTQTATFVFGGFLSERKFEYLPKDSTSWFEGKRAIPGLGFQEGCAVAAKSEQDIWMIGFKNIGIHWVDRRIFTFSVNDHTFQKLPTQLIVNRVGHKCAFIPNTNKIMITGGFSSLAKEYLNSTEMLDTEDGSINMASPMNFKRHNHGIGIATINGKDRLVVFGGFDGKDALDSIEVYNTEIEKWEITEIKLKEPKHSFGFLTLKLRDIISQLS